MSPSTGLKALLGRVMESAELSRGFDDKGSLLRDSRPRNSQLTLQSVRDRSKQPRGLVAWQAHITCTLPSY